MSAHTPGPWQTTQNPVDITVHSDRRLVAGVRLGKGPRGAEDEANARLIAAAPALLEALEELYEEAYRGFDPLAGLLVDARAAIAAARGEEVTT